MKYVDETAVNAPPEIYTIKYVREIDITWNPEDLCNKSVKIELNAMTLHLYHSLSACISYYLYHYSFISLYLLNLVFIYINITLDIKLFKQATQMDHQEFPALSSEPFEPMDSSGDSKGRWHRT